MSFDACIAILVKLHLLCVVEHNEVNCVPNIRLKFALVPHTIIISSLNSCIYCVKLCSARKYANIYSPVRCALSPRAYEFIFILTLIETVKFSIFLHLRNFSGSLLVIGRVKLVEFFVGANMHQIP